MRREAVISGSAPQLVESYWVLPGRLLAGEYPARVELPGAAERLDSLLAAGIDTFFDLTEPDELATYLPLLEARAALRGMHIVHQRFPIVDFDLPERSTMLAALDGIDAALDEGRRVYVHCWGGLGRTGMAVGCYLVRHGRTGEQALKQIADFWRTRTGLRYQPMSPETPAQARFVLDWREPDEPIRA